MSGMQGHYNAAAEERKPLMISFDDDDNILSTEVATITIVQTALTAGKFVLSIPATARNSMRTTSEARRAGSEAECRNDGTFHHERHQPLLKIGTPTSKVSASPLSFVMRT